MTGSPKGAKLARLSRRDPNSKFIREQVAWKCRIYVLFGYCCLFTRRHGEWNERTGQSSVASRCWCDGKRPLPWGEGWGLISGWVGPSRFRKCLRRMQSDRIPVASRILAQVIRLQRVSREGADQGRNVKNRMWS